MSDVARLLDLIEEGVVGHGGDLGGWTRRSDEALQLFDGRVTLRSELSDFQNDEGQRRDGVVHAHVFATLHEHGDEVLDACLIGTGDDRDGALREVAVLWITCVAGPIRSFIDCKPVCMTCQAGVEGGDPSQGYSHGDYGLPGLRAYVGPSIARGIDDRIQSAIDDTKPWFRFAAESAAPRRVHMAKSIVISSGRNGWRRELEIDGHDVSHQDPDWPAGVNGPEFGYLTRYAVFEFPRNSNEIRRRAELERTILHFAEHFSEYESVHRLMDEMVSLGFDADLVHETESISTIAFGRTLFEPHGVKYSPTIIRARRDGRVETGVPLMSVPAYTRARALAVRLRESMPAEDFQRICLYNAESQVILQAMEAQGDKLNLRGMAMYPCIVPDRGTTERTIDAALAMLQDLIEPDRHAPRKPWWKFW